MGEGSSLIRTTPAAAGGHDVTEVYERRAAQLWSFARRLGLTAEQAEDAVQEAFARLVRTEQQDGPIRQPDAWLFRAVNNLAMDQHRRDKRIREITSTSPASGSAVLSGASPDAADPADDIWAAVDRLPERQRAVVYLRYRADLDYASIARVLSITEVGARANAFRGLRRLRREVDR